MGDTRAGIRDELSRLISDGTVVLVRESIPHMPPEQRAALQDVLKKTGHLPGADAPDGKSQKKKTPSDAQRERFNFGSEYQSWYTRSLRVVEQLIPDRYAEFRDLYRPERRKSLDAETYGIADYIAGLSVSRYGERAFDPATVALSRIEQQVAILASAESRLDSILADITGVLEASLFDDELAAARNLLKARHVRSAGIMAGVILERHLQRVLANHNIAFRKTATLANLNDALRGADIYDVPQWRRLQHLTDIRNLCGHSGDREPSPEEVEGLINDVGKAITSIF